MPCSTLCKHPGQEWDDAFQFSWSIFQSAPSSREKHANAGYKRYHVTSTYGKKTYVYIYICHSLNIVYGLWSSITFHRTPRTMAIYIPMNIRLVVSTPLKIISQSGWFIPNIWKNKHVPNHQPDMVKQKLIQRTRLIHNNPIRLPHYKSKFSGL